MKPPVTYAKRRARDQLNGPAKRQKTQDDDRKSKPVTPPTRPSTPPGTKVIFDSFGSEPILKPTLPSPSRNKGLAKRMLSRTASSGELSNTGGSLQDQLRLSRADTVIDLTTSSVSSASSSSRSMTKPVTPTKVMKTMSFEDSSPPVKPQLSSMRTYAGSSRSFLVTVPTSQISGSHSQSLQDVESQEDLEIHETYSDLRARWGVDNSEDDPYPQLLNSPSSAWKHKAKSRETRPPPVPLPNNDVKSITELRNKGESRRFNDEVGYLFEGLDPESSISVRRGSALDIISKFSEMEFARKAKVADFTVQAWEALREAGAGDGDKVLDTALLVFTTLATRDVRDLVDLANRSDCVSIMFKMLEVLTLKNDTLGLINTGLSDVELKQAGIARSEKSLIANFNRLITKKSGIFSEKNCISNRLLITTILASLPPKFYQSENLPILLESLLSDVSLVPSRISGYTTGLALLPPASSTSYLDTPSFAHIENCLRLLEAFLLGRWRPIVDEDAAPLDLLSIKQTAISKGLVACCIAAEVLMRTQETEDATTSARKCLESTLRVLVNLSHDNEAWCKTLLQDEYTVPMIIRFIITAHKERYSSPNTTKQADYGDEEMRIQAFDRLCLALGLLTNLVQVDEKAKDLSRETSYYINCATKRSCIRVCACSDRTTALEPLVSIYLQHRKPSPIEDEDIDPIIRGHIAILFGLLMRDNVSNQRILLAAFPGSSTREKLAPLVESAQEFVDLYGQVMTKVARGEVDENEKNSDDDDEVPYKRAGGGDEKGESIAKDVVAFLEILSECPEL